jgi:hypothetical protein
MGIKSQDIIATAGGVTTGAPSTVTVGATSTAILAADSTRQYLSITNLSDQRVDLNVAGGAAVSERGTPLSAAAGEFAGGTYAAIGKPAQLAVYGICDSGSKAVAVQTLTTE